MYLMNSFNNISEINSQKSFVTNQAPSISIDTNFTSDFLSKIFSKNPFLVNTIDEKGETFLSYAIKRNNKKIINLILSSPLLDINYLDKNDNTYLHLAVIYKNLEAIRLLIKKGISINAQNKYGNTALHLAYYINNKDIINCLIAFNVETNIKNYIGLIPEEIKPTNEIDKIVGFDVSICLDENSDEDELKFDKGYKTIETTKLNKGLRLLSNSNTDIKLLSNKKHRKRISNNFNKNDKQSPKIDIRKKSSLFYNTGNALRKISNIPWSFDNDKFIRKESLNFPFYLELLGQTKEETNSPGNNETRFNTLESNSNTNTNIIIFNNTKKGYRPSIRRISEEIDNSNSIITNKLLYDFLLQINLQIYYYQLDDKGFSNILKIIEDTKNGKYIEDTQLIQIGINKPGDRAKILIRLEEKANLFDFTVPKAVYYSNKYNNDFEQIEKDDNLNKLYLWLKDINLEIYFYNFINNGYHSIDLLYVQMISNNPLTDLILKNEILIEKLGYRLRILNKLREEWPSYLKELKGASIIYNKEENCNICDNCKNCNLF